MIRSLRDKLVADRCCPSGLVGVWLEFGWSLVVTSLSSVVGHNGAEMNSWVLEPTHPSRCPPREASVCLHAWLPARCPVCGMAPPVITPRPCPCLQPTLCRLSQLLRSIVVLLFHEMPERQIGHSSAVGDHTGSVPCPVLHRPA